MVEHVDAVLGDARGDEVELAPFGPEPAEVRDDRGVAEQALHLVDVEPGGDAALEVAVHPVAHALEDRDDPEGAHVLGEVPEVDVGDAPVERHVRRAVEEGERALHVALVAQGYVPGLRLGLRPQDAVEVPEKGGAPLLVRVAVCPLDAAADDGLVGLREPLVPLGHGRAGQRQEGVYLEGHLGGARLVCDVGEVERVEVRVRVGGEPYALPAVRLDHGGVLPGGVEDDDLVLGVREDGVLYLALDGERLPRSGLAGDEAHGAREPLPIAQDEVRRLLVLPVVASSLVRELLRREGHLYGHLRGGHHPGNLDVVVPEGEYGVQALALAVVEGVRLDRVAPRRRHDLHHLLVEPLPRRRVRVHEPRVDVEPLVLVLEMVEQVLRLLLRVFELGGQYLEVVPLLDRSHLLVDDLLVHPCDPLLHEGDRLRLVHGLDVEGDREGDRQVDDVGEAAVRQLAAEPAEHEDLAPRVAGFEAGGAAFGLEVEGGGAHEVLRREPSSRADRVPGEQVRLPGAQQPVQDADALGPREGSGGASHLGEGLLRVPAHSGEPRDRRVDGGRAHGEGEVALPDQVGHAFLHLVVEYPVVLLRVRRSLRVVGREEALRSDLLGGNGAVDHGELHAAVGAEVVEQLAPSGEDGALALLAGGLVADVLEHHRLAEKPFLDLSDPVGVHQVVAYGGVDVPSRAAHPPLLRHPPRELALLLGDAALEGLAPGGAFPLPTLSGHASRPPFSCSSCAPCGPPAGTRFPRPPSRACFPSSTRARRRTAHGARASPGTSPP